MEVCRQGEGTQQLTARTMSGLAYLAGYRGDPAEGASLGQAAFDLLN